MHSKILDQDYLGAQPQHLVKQQSVEGLQVASEA